MTAANLQTLKPHVSLNVSDLAASVAFYRAMFGVEPARLRADYAKFDLESPALNLALNQSPKAPSREGVLSHLGIQVAKTEEVRQWREIWIERGLLTRDEMETTCCYAKQDKTWVFDPDGNEWEVFTVLGEADEPATAPTSCCQIPASAEPEAGREA